MRQVIAALMLVAAVAMMVGPLFVPYNLKRNIWDQTARNFRIYFCGMALFLLACIVGDAGPQAEETRARQAKIEYNDWVRECRAARTGCAGYYGQGEK